MWNMCIEVGSNSEVIDCVIEVHFNISKQHAFMHYHVLFTKN